MNQHHTVQHLTFEASWLILTVDGETIRVPIKQASNRLAQASETERQVYRVSPSGYGIHWPMIDEDLSIDGLLKLAQTQQAVI